MEVQKLRIVTRNIASSKRVYKILDIVKSDQPYLLLLQEVTLYNAELTSDLINTNYLGEANVDISSPSSPGTAAVWLTDLSGLVVTTLVNCQLQQVQIGQTKIPKCLCSKRLSKQAS